MSTSAGSAVRPDTSKSAALKQVCFCIVLYESDPVKLRRLFQSIQGVRNAHEIWVADNSARDTLRELCMRHGAHYLHFDRNLGFGTAHNRLLERTRDRFRYHLLINPDIHFEPSTVTRLLRRMERTPEVVQLMPRVTYPDGRPQYPVRPLPRPLHLLARRLRLMPVEGAPTKQALRGERPLFFSGCFVLLRSSVIRDMELFDERFFLYFEDVDLSRRLGDVGRQEYWPMVSVVHDWEGGSRRRLRLTVHHIRSFIKYFNKYGWRPLW